MDGRTIACGTGSTGRKSSITTAVQLTTTSTPVKRGVLIVADSSNSVAVYVGFSSAITRDSADGTDGLPIQPGGSVTIEIDDVSKIYATAGSSSKLWWVGV